MKKRITKLMGIGLVVAVLVSLLISSAPVSAKILDWSPETIPTDSGKVLLTKSPILSNGPAPCFQTNRHIGSKVNTRHGRRKRK